MTAAGDGTKPLLLYLVTEDWYFLSHRLPMARAAREAGFRVAVATRVGDAAEAIVAEGFEVFPLKLRRRGTGPLSELAAIAELVSLYRRLRPVIVHHIALKPAVYGSLAAHLARVPAVINSVAGLGYTFIARELKARALKLVMLAAFRVLFRGRNRWLVVQNQDDYALFAGSGMTAHERTVIIRGSGVDTDVFVPQQEPSGPLRAALVGRMLWDKGVGEAVEAARLLRKWQVPLRLVLVGAPDPANPKSIPEADLCRWRDEGLVEWWGHRSDIISVWAECAVAVLPSYREGLPKSLLEAAACGRPLVATDVPGCRELVRHEVNGLLVPARDGEALAHALRRLVEIPELRARLGAQARRDAEIQFSATTVAGETARLYVQASAIALTKQGFDQ